MSKQFLTILSLILVSGAAGFVGGRVGDLTRRAPALEGPPNAIAAKRFVVVDEQGRVRAEWTASGLELLGEDGRARISLRLQDWDKPILVFSEGRVLFGSLGSDTPSKEDDDWGLEIFDASREHIVAALTADEHGKSGSLVLRGTHGHRDISLPGN